MRIPGEHTSWSRILLGWLLVCGVGLVAIPAWAATNDLTTTLQRGLFEEEANQNLAAAVQAYEAVASQFDKDRKLASTAIFRLGECYRKQGNTNAAATQYERILREFPDQATLVTLSRQNLVALGNLPAAPAAPALSDAARQEQKRLLQEEIKIAEKQVEIQKAQVERGVLPSDAPLTAEREVLKLKRQLAALEAGAPVSFAAAEMQAPALSSEAEEVTRIKALIKDSPDLINAADANTGETLLQTAAAKGKLAIVKVLLENGAAVDGLQQPGHTALHFAAANGHKAVVDFLLSKGAKPDATTEAGVTPLHLAARKGYESVAKALLAAGAPVNAATKDTVNVGRSGAGATYSAGSGQTPLHLAAAAGYPGMVQLLLDKGASPNAEDAEGRTPMSYAAQKPAILQLLLAAHADPNTGRANLPLAMAAYYGDLPAVKVLLAGGADPNTEAKVNTSINTRGTYFSSGTKCSPLFLAVNQRRPDVVKELIKAKGNPNARGPDGLSLSENALSDAPTLQALLEGGANANQKRNGAPLLAIAVNMRQPQVVELLLDHQAAVNAATEENGQTALHLAAQLGLKDIVELLLKRGANLEAHDKDGCTPLWRAVDQGQTEVVELLLDKGADPNERNNFGETALARAKRRPTLLRPPVSVDPATGLPRAVSPDPKTTSLVEVLRQHGALEQLPQPDRITLERRATGYTGIWLVKGTNDWNQFTALELLGMQYGLLSSTPGKSESAPTFLRTLFSSQSSQALTFPDLAQLRIRQPAADGKHWEERAVNIAPVLESGDCAKDVVVGWGDVLEVPEAVHPLNEMWGGFSPNELTNFLKCLRRQVQVVIQGQATNLVLGPKLIEPRYAVTPAMWREVVSVDAKVSFWLKPALLDSRLVLTSSDLTRVKVTRIDRASGKERQWVLDCSPAAPAPEFWLKDGDRIEVPERTGPALATGPSSGPLPPPALLVPSPVPGQPPAPRAPSPPGQPPVAAVRRGPQRILRTPNGVMPQLEDETAASGAVRYSPNADDFKLLQNGYRKDRSLPTRREELWQQRAQSDLAGRACPGVWTGTEMVVFGGEGIGTSFADGARYCLAEDTWAMLPEKNGPSSRTGQVMVWSGKEVLVWGGFGGVWGDNTNHNDGARYNPKADQWKPMTTKGAPEARFDLTAVWGNGELLVWGGYTDNHSRYQGAHADAFVNTGGRYNPATDSWKSITTTGAPSRRFANTAVWTGKEMLIWGGVNARKVLGDGGRYNPARNTWKPMSTEGAPSPRGSHVAVWTGQEMLVWGGSARDPQSAADYFANGGRYNPETDTWKPMSTVGAPKGRVQTAAVWTGSEMILWGGVNDAQAADPGNGGRFTGTGGRYNPVTDTWKEITTQGAPSPRLTCGVWTGSGLLIFGGYGGTHLNDTWFYSPQREMYPYVKQ